MRALELERQQLGASAKTRIRSIARWLFRLVACVVPTALVLELSLPLLHRRYANYFRQSIAASNLNLDRARRFVASPRFDPQLGWDEDPPARNFIATERYFAQSYGDSYVKGEGVGSEETWQAHFERLTGQAILNLGVGGYGLDQAVLKFERNASNYPTRVAILGLYPQMYRRALSYHSFYYFTNSEAFTYAFKPIFVRRAEGFELIGPPCAEATCLIDVLSNRSHEVWRRLERDDYWYRANLEKPVAGFPNTIKYLSVVRQIERARRERRGEENYFFVNPGSIELIEYLVQRFANDSKQLGMAPVCLMLYSPDDLRVIKDGIRLDDALLKFLAAEGIPYVDAAPYMVEHYRGKDGFEALGLSALDRHLNSRGNKLVAEALADALRQNQPGRPDGNRER